MKLNLLHRLQLKIKKNNDNEFNNKMKFSIRNSITSNILEKDKLYASPNNNLKE